MVIFFDIHHKPGSFGFGWFLSKKDGGGHGGFSHVFLVDVQTGKEESGEQEKGRVFQIL